MQGDYYAFRQAELNNTLSELEQAAVALSKARDRQARQQAENQMAQAARNAVAIAPHLAYLWFWARKEEPGEEDSKRASEIANSIRDAWQKKIGGRAISDAFHLTPDMSAIAQMPPLSFMLRIPFRLQKPYISKDESDFYLLDNPLRKEKVFQAPMMAATSWKGALRVALWQLGYKQDHEVTIRLLGNPRESEEGQAGRLHFFPTFFDKIGLEVINPHDRRTGVGARGPILMECVPQGTTGDLFLLYVPFGPSGQSEKDRRAEVAEDLAIVAKGIQAMLTTYGFGAKISSGFGIAQDQLADEGKLAIRAELAGEATSTPAAPPEPEQPKLPRYLESPGVLHPDLRRADGSLKSEDEYRLLIEGQGKKYGKKHRQLYEKAKRWWEREEQKLSEATPREQESEPELTKAPSVSDYTFRSLSELCDLAQHVAKQLRKEGDS